MRTAVRIVLFSLLLTAVWACAEKEELPLVPADYSGWSRVNRVDLDYPIPGHMDRYRVIYINEAGKNYTVMNRGERKYFEYPEGTIIVKEIYSTMAPVEGEKPVSLTVMVKKQDHPAAREGWVWIVKDFQTGKENILSQEFCITCHSNANEFHPYGDGNPKEDFRDFVFFPYEQ